MTDDGRPDSTMWVNPRFWVALGLLRRGVGCGGVGGAGAVDVSDDLRRLAERVAQSGYAHPTMLIDATNVIALLDERDRYRAALEDIARGGYSGASYVARKALEGSS